MSSIRGIRIYEWLKSGLIVLLTVSALLLGWRTGLFNDFFGAIPLFGDVAEIVRGAGGSGAVESGGAPLKEAARPLTIVITDEEGGRHGIKYDTVARNAAYDRTSSILNEALGSASAPLEISEDEWREALLRPGAYFEYMIPVRLSILSGWLGTRLPSTMEDVSLRRLFIVFGEDRSRVYYQNDDNKRFFVAVTASSAGKAQELEMYTPNGAQFAFETSVGASENAPYLLILEGNDYHDVRASAAGSVEELLDVVQHAMGHSDETPTTYTGSAGALVRVGTQFNIRADSHGRVTYRRTDASPISGEERTLSESAMIERARVIISDTVGSLAGASEVFFETLEHGAGGYRYVYFGYYIAGGYIHLYEDGYAARLTFFDGTLTEMELIFRSYALRDEFTRLPPKRQALAAAGEEFILCYSDTGVERLHPAWVLYN